MSRDLQLQLNLIRDESLAAAKDYPFELYKHMIQKQRECVAFTTVYGALMGGNQTGKSTSAILRVRFHATGQYPDGWIGTRTTRGQDLWICGDRWGTLRDSIQKKMFGDDLESPGKVEPGKTPPIFTSDMIVGRPRMAPNSGGAIESIRVRHACGGVTEITFKTYHMGMDGVASATIDGVVVDEECPYDTLQELSMRILVKRGWIFCTFTPLRGRSEYYKFLERMDPRWGTVRFVSQDEVSHLTAEMIATMEATFAGDPGQMQARRTGRPVIASGMVFPFDSEDLWLDWFPMHDQMPRLVGMDIGVGTPTVGCPIAIDTNTGDHFVYACYNGEIGKEARHHHFAMLDAFGDLNFSVDMAANQRNPETARTMTSVYNTLAHGENFERLLHRDEWKYRTVPNRSFGFGHERITELLRSGKLWFLKARNPGDPLSTEGLRNQFEEAIWDDEGKAPKNRGKLHWLDALRYAVVGIGYARPPRLRRPARMLQQVSIPNWSPIPGNMPYR